MTFYERGAWCRSAYRVLRVAAVSQSVCLSVCLSVRDVNVVRRYWPNVAVSLFTYFLYYSIRELLFKVTDIQPLSHRTIITFCVSPRRREMYCGHARLCVSVCLSAAACPHYCTDPEVSWGSGRGCLLVVHTIALRICIAIGARVALLWQRNANAKC